ncbi:alkyl sulfatase C-terminal domain-containing protein [Streptomyces beijiangensis]|uniref:Alkyl sulfatase C-terminal domain-containing protein n=1 Tax=Streptomyces beijiangensis TaxID=163361 RepID=A0A939F545_9ACTN|nr:alkyl sulfatase C-terminal domain-containing protein [Streptomyces beijiangensis]MBO0511197.1 hypothetical protein [Streptomyces beijiangensis]
MAYLPRQEFADSDRGFITPFPDKLYSADGRVIFDASRDDSIADDAPAPDSVNPSLWRQSQLIRKGGLEFEFLYAPDTEAPEEMHIWPPQLGALTCAENANHSLHNIQTPRGARTRDARNFARCLDETLERWGDDRDGDPVSLHPQPPVEAARPDSTETDETWTMGVRRGVPNARRGASPDTQLTVTGPKATLVGVRLKPAAAGQLAKAGKIKLEGDGGALRTLAGLLDEFDPDFPIVTP